MLLLFFMTILPKKQYLSDKGNLQGNIQCFKKSNSVQSLNNRSQDGCRTKAFGRLLLTMDCASILLLQ